MKMNRLSRNNFQKWKKLNNEGRDATPGGKISDVTFTNGALQGFNNKINSTFSVDVTLGRVTLDKSQHGIFNGQFCDNEAESNENEGIKELQMNRSNLRLNTMGFDNINTECSNAQGSHVHTSENVKLKKQQSGSLKNYLLKGSNQSKGKKSNLSTSYHAFNTQADTQINKNFLISHLNNPIQQLNSFSKQKSKIPTNKIQFPRHRTNLSLQNPNNILYRENQKTKPTEMNENPIPQSSTHHVDKSKILHQTRGSNNNQFTLTESNETLSPETSQKLNEIKSTIIELLSRNSKKNLILKELYNIYKYVLNYSQMMEDCNSIHNYGNENLNYEIEQIKAENEQYRKDNEKLMNRIEKIDHNFERITEENTELKEYLKTKTESIEEMKISLKHFHSDLEKIKQNQEKKSVIDAHSNKISMKNINKLKFPTGISDYSPGGFGKVLHIETLSLKSEGSTEDKKSVNLDSLMVNHVDENPRINLLKDNACSRPDLITFNTEEEKINEDSLLNISIGHNDLHNQIKSSLKINHNAIPQSCDSSTNPSSKAVILPKELNLDNLPKTRTDFNEEFLENLDKFSSSWRVEVNKMMANKSK